MSLPAPLAEDRDFMWLYGIASLGTNDSERDSLDNLIALAFMKGQNAGIVEGVNALREVNATCLGGQRP